MKDIGTMIREYHEGHAPCIAGPCQCACGCKVWIGCSGGYFMCAVCHVRNGREDEDHYLPPLAAVGGNKEET